MLGLFWIFLQGFASPLVLISGFIFGYYYSAIIVVTILSIGSVIIFWFCNIYYKDLVSKKFQKKYKKIIKKLDHNQLLFMIIYRLIGGIPFQIQNIIPCLTNVNLKNYFVGTFIGLFPQSIIITSLGAGLEKQIYQYDSLPPISDILITKEILIPIIIFLFFLIGVFCLKKKTNFKAF